MEKIQFSAIEKEMANFNFAELQNHTDNARKSFAAASTAADVKSNICSVWSKIRKYVKMGEVIPFVGKFITILANLLDGICEI